LNPVRAGIVDDPLKYPWSSHGYYAIGAKVRLVDENPLFVHLGRSLKARQATYRSITAGWLEMRPH